MPALSTRKRKGGGTVKLPKAGLVNNNGADDLISAVGRKIRDQRKRVKLTQAQLGAAAGLAQSYVFDIESTGANLTLKALANIASALKVSIKDLMPDGEFESEDPLSVANLKGLLSKIDERMSAYLAFEAERRIHDAELQEHFQSLKLVRIHLDKIVAKGS